MLIRKDFYLPNCIFDPTQNWSLQPFFTNLSIVNRFSPFLQSSLTLNSQWVVTRTAWYSGKTSTRSLSFSMATFSASLAKTYGPPTSITCSCCISRRTQAPASLWLQKPSDKRRHEFALFPTLWHQHRLAKVTCAWSWRLCRINPTVHPFGTNIHALLEYTPYCCRLLSECAVTKQHYPLQNTLFCSIPHLDC